MKTGTELIAAERERQITEEGRNLDWIHEKGELLDAAVCYAEAVQMNDHRMYEDWPWAECWWKPSDDPIRNLVKAGALIAAEIDRLQILKS